MKSKIWMLWVMFSYPLSAQQNGHPQFPLPAVLNNASGIERDAQGLLWSLNDTGGESEIYGINAFGQLLRTLRITNANNQDWEDITKDDQGRLYIGDIGDNNSTRSQRTVYRIPNPSQINGSQTTAEMIHFTLADHQDFPPPADARNFDLESMIWWNDSLYFFTKNRSAPFNGYTKCYRIPSKPGQHVATLVDSFQTGLGSLFQWWVTGAAVSPDKRHLVLLGFEKLWIFTCFDGSNFFEYPPYVVDLMGSSEKEGITFIDDTTLAIVDEKRTQSGGNLYLIKIPALKNYPSFQLAFDSLNRTLEVQHISGWHPNHTSIQWQHGPQTARVSVANSGWYHVQVDAGRCTAKDSIFVTIPDTSSENPIDTNVVIPVDTNVQTNIQNAQLASVLDVKLFPNPTKNQVRLQVPLDVFSVECMIYDAQGKLLHQTPLTIHQGYSEWLYTEQWKLSPGIYWIHLHVKEQSFRKKWMVF